jgi:FtsP/CotA-like multicopper oxidase with cupredoxin domain
MAQCRSRLCLVAFLLFSVMMMISSVPTAEAKPGFHFHKWEVKYAYKSPDCFKKLAITINGDSPGPTIYATQGDRVVVTLNNTLPTENVAVHWHGIRQVLLLSSFLHFLCKFICVCSWLQIGTPWSDGTEGVTQCPIMPGDSFTYEFVVDRVSPFKLLGFFFFFIFFLIKAITLKNIGRDVSIPCALWNAIISRAVWIHYCFSTSSWSS